MLGTPVLGEDSLKMETFASNERLEGFQRKPKLSQFQFGSFETPGGVAQRIKKNKIGPFGIMQISF